MSEFPFALVQTVDERQFDFVALVRADIHDESQLFAELALKLRFPSYFGANWDALDECIADLEWLKGDRFAIVHEAVPHLSRCWLTVYLEILRNAIKEHASKGRTLVVTFPERTRVFNDAWTGVRHP